MEKIHYKQIEIHEASKEKTLFPIIEALLFVSGEPLKVKDMCSIIQCDEDYLKQTLDEMMLEYEYDKRGIKLININDSYQLVTKPLYSDYVQKLLRVNSRQSLSQASLETLAIIAYRQPITRVDIDEIRGVKSDRAVSTLAERNLIREAGRKNVAGRPILYEVTDEFFRYFGIKNIKDMPFLDDLLKKYEDINEEQTQKV